MTVNVWCKWSIATYTSSDLDMYGLNVFWHDYGTDLGRVWLLMRYKKFPILNYTSNYKSPSVWPWGGGCVGSISSWRRSEDIIHPGYWVLYSFIHILVYNGNELLVDVILSMMFKLNVPDSKVPETNMGPIWGRQDPDGPHVGPMNFARCSIPVARDPSFSDALNHGIFQCFWENFRVMSINDLNHI